MGRDDFLNDGVILRPGGADVDPARPERTFIISGVGRGGTTMVAALLRAGDVYFGDDVSDLVHEDREIMAALEQHDRAELDRLIALRDARTAVWGFKAPVLTAYLRPADLARFRNPHLILVFRDPAAIAVRHAIAEHESPILTVREAANAMAGLLDLVLDSTVPALLLSYEKAILFPETVVDAVMRFCALPPAPDLRERLLACVRPNDPDYATNARRKFGGKIDALLGGMLFGWCWQEGLFSPIELDVLLDGTVATRVTAGDFREDLAQVGINDGRHGFGVDLAALGANPDTAITVRVTGRSFELGNSGLTLRQLPGFDPAHFASIQTG